MPELEDIRKSIRETDSKIIELMIQRNDLAKAVGDIKKKKGISLRNRELEAEIMQRFAGTTEGTSFPPEYAVSVAEILIKSSVELQSPMLRKRCEKKVTVIGGNGKMGKWIVQYMRGLGANVDVIDLNVGMIEQMRDSDIIIISVPISSVGDVLRIADQNCKDDSLIFDIASVKSPFLPQLKEMAKRRKVCSVHPMFGPSAVSLTDRNIMICDCGCGTANDETTELFGNDDASVVTISVERHDELMAYVLALAHASNITFFTALRMSDIPIKELRTASSTTFDRTLRTSVPVSQEDALLYHQIQHLNVNSPDMWKNYEDALNAVKNASLSDAPERFAELMELGKKYLDQR
ncbi:MAG: prephenate dehydrogenase/arogenate dehydrogenase family protein [Methanomassiliicoccaceae archaeon]|nr:prephenate dehydrogenase/arogenate dehydrogenase family protein [Methanomassiliicoccaceae archaeon]